jgi:hypothetical protein
MTGTEKNVIGNMLRGDDKYTRHISRSKQVMKWSPPGRRKRGRPKLTWVEGIQGLMGEKGRVEEDWNDRYEWRKKIL